MRMSALTIYRIKIKCKYCNSEFITLKNLIWRKKFCCFQCYVNFKLLKRKSIRCDYCEKIYYSNSSGIESHKNHFCSRSCFEKWRLEKRIKGECFYCHKKYFSKKSILNRNKRNFCSPLCYNKQRNIEKKKSYCLMCNKKMFLNKKSQRKFCSKKCYSKWKSDWFYIKCEYCHKKYLYTHSKFKRFKHHFCSRRCFIKYKLNKRKKIKCLYCRKILLVSKASKTKFCSRECVHQYKVSITSAKIKCNYCNKIIIRSLIRIKNHKKHFCNQDCFNKARLKGIIIIKSKKRCMIKNGEYIRCNFCKKLFYIKCSNLLKHNLHFCCIECRVKFEKSKSTIIECDYCKNKFKRLKISIHKHNFCCREHFGKWISENRIWHGENNPAWNNGSSFDLYPVEFNDELKLFIKNRDKYICQNSECRVHEKECLSEHSVHHIDYCKNHNDPINLITLCNKCHAKSGTNRTYWKQYYERIQIDRKVHELEKYVN